MNTLFVVGAGASCELKMPAGVALKEQITRLLTFEFDAFGRASKGSKQIDDELRSLNSKGIIDSHSFKRHYSAADVASRGLHLAASIDNFLNAHQSNEELVLIGKMAIVEAILDAEKKALAPLWKPQSANIETTSLADTWYAKLFAILVQNNSKEKIKEVFVGITFVVFNYDRAVEFIFPLLLRDYYNVSLADAIDAFSSACIIHPYGKVGDLQNPLTHLTLGFGTRSKPLCDLAQEINTFTEGEKDAVLSAQIDEAISEAKKIIFLGYGFIEMNNKILTRGENKGASQIFATTYKISETDKSAVISKLISGFSFSSILTRADGTKIKSTHIRQPEVKCADVTCNQFFEEFRLSLF